MLWLIPVLLVTFLLATWFAVVQPLLRPADAEDPPAVDPARLEGHVRALSETFVPRGAWYPQNLDRTAAYIRAAFEGTGGRVSEQTYEIRGKTYRNVLLQFGPQTGERVVVGAHYDAVGEQPGADDNASGVAGLIELARLLDGADLPTTVELVAYTLEEPPFFRSKWMGSAVHARSLRERGVRVRLMIALEMLGYFSDEPHSQRFPFPLFRLFYPSTGNAIAVIGKLDGGRDVRRVKGAMRRTAPLPVYSFNGPRIVVGVGLSDHRSYWAQGYRAVMITDTAFYRNPNYHTVRDTAETLDYGRMALVVAGLYGALLELAR